jgi:hypothetical protein
MVAPLDDCAMILGQDFLKHATEIPIPHEGFLVFLDESKIPNVPMMMKIKLGKKLRSSAIRLVEGFCESEEKRHDKKQQKEVTLKKCSLGGMKQKEQIIHRLKTLEIS